MPSKVTIRRESLVDHAAIGSVINAAFAGRPYASGTEAELVESLRRDRAITLSLVAEVDGAVVGQVVFSPAVASDGSQGWYALGPVAVQPAMQRQGIGSELVRTGLRMIAQLDAIGCIVVGDPAYYQRFGFELSPANVPDGIPAEYYMVKMIGRQKRPVGAIGFHGAFTSTT